MQRRELLQVVGAVVLTPLLAPLSAEQRLELGRTLHARLGVLSLRVLTPAQNAAVVAVAEGIIPRTDTPGATDARVSEFVDLLLAQYYKEDEKARLLKGIDAIDAEAIALGGKTFA